jgi:hypothetical protein
LARPPRIPLSARAISSDRLISSRRAAASASLSNVRSIVTWIFSEPLPFLGRPTPRLAAREWSASPAADSGEKVSATNSFEFLGCLGELRGVHFPVRFRFLFVSIHRFLLRYFRFSDSVNGRAWITKMFQAFQRNSYFLPIF